MVSTDVRYFHAVWKDESPSFNLRMQKKQHMSPNCCIQSLGTVPIPVILQTAPFHVVYTGIKGGLRASLLLRHEKENVY